MSALLNVPPDPVQFLSKKGNSYLPHCIIAFHLETTVVGKQKLNKLIYSTCKGHNEFHYVLGALINKVKIGYSNSKLRELRKWANSGWGGCLQHGLKV